MRRVWWHWQNLNDKPGGRMGSPLRHGRSWLHVGPYTLGWSWSFWRHFCHAEFTVSPDSESTLGASIAFPGFAFWLHLDTPWGHRLAEITRRKDGSKYGTERCIGLSVHDWSLWWYCWADEMEWRPREDPWWQHGSFNLPDWLLGRRKYSEAILEERAIVVPMPEYGYHATAQLQLAEWKRPRWPFASRQLRTKIEIPNGIPVPGKGENAWDCEGDATFGMTCAARTIEEGIARLVESCLRDRRRHGGNGWRPGRKVIT